MSKRFGRNQKRQMRLQVEKAERIAKSERGNADRCRKDSIEAIRVVEMIRRINPFFPALEQATEVGEHIYTLHHQEHALSPEPFMRGHESPQLSPIPIRLIDLYQLEADLVDSDEFMRSATVLASVTDRNGRPLLRSCLRGSVEGLKHMGAEHIALDLARHLEREIAKL